MQDIYVKDFKGTSDTTAQITVVNVSSPNTIIEPALFPEGGNKESELVVGTGTRPKAGQESVFTFKGLVKGKKYQVWLYNRSHRDTEICDDGEYTPDSCGYYGSTVTESGETLWVTFNGLAITPKLYGSVENKTKKVARLYGPVSSKTTRLGKLYGSVEGKTRLVARFLLPPPEQSLLSIEVYASGGVSDENFQVHLEICACDENGESIEFNNRVKVKYEQLSSDHMEVLSSRNDTVTFTQEDGNDGILYEATITLKDDEKISFYGLPNKGGPYVVYALPNSAANVSIGNETGWLYDGETNQVQVNYYYEGTWKPPYE